MISRRTLLAAAPALAAAPLARTAQAQGNPAQGKPIRIGVMNDGSGPYRDIAGLASAAAVRLAVQEMAGSVNAEVLYADHQNKPDVGAGIARQWFDRDGVDLIVDVNTSSVALAVNQVCKEKDRAYVNVGAATADLTGPQCTPVTVHWSYDTWMLARSTGGAVVQAGGDSWYFLTADYVFGQQLQRDTTGFVTRGGGKVLGASSYPVPGTTDFSSFLISAQASGAKVLGLANAGTDTINSIKQAAEFGLTRQMKVAALLMYVSDVHGLGLETAQGLYMTESFYWDLNDRTRGFSDRFKALYPGARPNMDNAGCYAGALHYLKAAKDMGVAAAQASGAAAVARMKAMPTADDAFGAARIREDGLAIIPSFLFQVKTPAESRGPWDYLKVVVMTPADQAWKPLAESGCPLVRT